MHANAGGLFQNAIESCRELSSPDLTFSQVKRNSLGAILFASMSAEAFINEIQYLASLWNEHPTKPAWAKALHEILGEVETSRASIESRYQIAKWVLSGSAFDKGSAPFQHFHLFVAVRNIIAHAKPAEAIVEMGEKGEYKWTGPKTIAGLQQIGVVRVEEDLLNFLNKALLLNMTSDLIPQIATQEVGIWGCKTVSAIVNALLDVIPPPFNERANLLYRAQFIVPEDL